MSSPFRDFWIADEAPVESDIWPWLGRSCLLPSENPDFQRFLDMGWRVFRREDEKALRAQVQDLPDKLFFEDLPQFQLFPEKITLDILAREAGIFSSSSDARRNGFFGPVPAGVNEWGTKKKRFFTIRPKVEGCPADVDCPALKSPFHQVRE